MRIPNAQGLWRTGFSANFLRLQPVENDAPKGPFTTLKIEPPPKSRL